MQLGLDRLYSFLSPRGHYVEASGGASTLSGPFLRLEGGYRLSQAVGLFGLTQWRPAESVAAAGVRLWW